jgi:hypothetical protein
MLWERAVLGTEYNRVKFRTEQKWTEGESSMKYDDTSVFGNELKAVFRIEGE